MKAKSTRAQARLSAPPAKPSRVPARAVHDATGRDPSRTSGPAYPDALGLYQQGIQCLQRHQFAAAAEALRSVLSLYPEERELHERVRLYLNVCDRHLAQAAGPRTRDERLFAATLAMNAGRLDEALGLLREVQEEEPEHDGALYMLAVAYAQRREHAQALGFLQRAVALNSDNRTLAQHEPDLEELLQDPSARAWLRASVATATDTQRASTARPRARR